MTDLRAYVASAGVAAGLLLVATAHADSIVLPSVSAGQNALGGGTLGRITDANAEYLIVDNGEQTPPRIWNIAQHSYVDLPDGSIPLTFGNKSTSGYTVAGTFGGQAYQWTLNGTTAAATPMAETTAPAVYGTTGSIVVGEAWYQHSWVPKESQEMPIQYATYWKGDKSYILPDHNNQLNYSRAYAVSGNTAVGIVSDGTKEIATAWQIPSNNGPATQIQLNYGPYRSQAASISGNVVGGYVWNEDMDNRATIWRLAEDGSGVRKELSLHPDQFQDADVWYSDVSAVLADVQIGDILFDIAVGDISTVAGIQTAVLWVLTDEVFGAESDFKMIELTDPIGQDLAYSYATSIVVDNGQLAIYGYGVRDDLSEVIPLMWHMDGVGAQVPEAMTASLLLVGTCALFLRRPRRS